MRRTHWSLLTALSLAASLVACGDDVGPDDEARQQCSAAQEAIDDLAAPVDLVEFGDRAGAVSSIALDLSTSLDVLELDDDSDRAMLVDLVDALVDMSVALTDARRAAALGDVDGATVDFEVAAAALDGVAERAADDFGQCLLEIGRVQPPDEDVVPVTDPPITDPPETDPPETDPPSTDPLDYPFTVFDPTTTLLLPDGYEWFPYDEDDHREFLSGVATSKFADELVGVSTGAVDDTGGEFVMLVREMVFADVVEGTEVATSLEEIYLRGTPSDAVISLGGLDGRFYVDDDRTTGWVGFTGATAIVLQFPGELDPNGIADAYVALNYGDGIAD